MEAVVQQYSIDKQCFKIQKKQFLNENDRRLDKIISQDIVNIVVNSLLDINTSVNVKSSVALNDSVNYVEICNKCLKLEVELIKQHNIVEKDKYNRLSKSFSKLKQHCISLELAMQLNKEIFQKKNTSMNQTEPSFDQLFEMNNLKAELQAKDITIEKLKANIKHLNKTSTTNSVKKDIDEIETISIELEHIITKLITKNEHLKQTYKQLYDLIKPSRVQAKEHVQSLVNQLNQKKFKGKDIVDNVAQASNAITISPGMYKLDPVTLAPKDKNNRETHIYYLKYTMEQNAILREIVEQSKSLNPLDSASYSACKYVKLIQELLGYVRETCPDIHKPSEKLVAVMPINRKKTISSMFDARHELCFLEFVSDMNASFKCKSVKKAKKKEEWKPTGKVFTKIGYNWRPTGRTFTLYLDSGCSKHMTGDRSQLTNFVHKFLGTVKFGNDQIAKIMGYDLEVAFRKHMCFVRNQEGDDLLSGSRETNLYTLSIGYMMAYSPISSKDEAPDFIIKFLKMIQVRLNMTVRNIRTNNGTEFVNQTLHSYYKSVGIYHETSVARSPQQNGVVESSGLVTNPIPQQPCNPPPRNDWDRLFQPMFDEYFNHPTIAVSLVLVAAASRVVDLADSPVSMPIDQDAPSISIPSIQDQEHSPIIFQGFKESPKTPHFHDDPWYEKDITPKDRKHSKKLTKPDTEWKSCKRQSQRPEKSKSKVNSTNQQSKPKP
ncbi:pyruvate, phosphate dikinase regulatory protein, chloroplastic [Tanacetum coccineum]